MSCEELMKSNKYMTENFVVAVKDVKFFPLFPKDIASANLTKLQKLIFIEALMVRTNSLIDHDDKIYNMIVDTLISRACNDLKIASLADYRKWDMKKAGIDKDTNRVFRKIQKSLKKTICIFHKELEQELESLHRKNSFSYRFANKAKSFEASLASQNCLANKRMVRNFLFLNAHVSLVNAGNEHALRQEILHGSYMRFPMQVLSMRRTPLDKTV